MKILIADDSEPIRRRLIERLLILPDIKIAEAVDTPDALRQAVTFMPDVAIFDIRMPGGGGIKALNEIKTLKPGTTVIIMTNYPYAQYRRKCLDAGADFFFDKSTEFEQMVDVIRDLMQPGNVSEVALHTAASQLVAAKEELEKATQRQRDMNILSLLHKTGAHCETDRAYVMWEKTFDAMPDLVAIFDADQRIVRVNKAMSDRLDMSGAELVEKKCYECFHGTHHPVSGCPYEAMMKDHQTHSAEFYNEHLGGWFDVQISPIYEKNHLIGVIHVARDVTERKQRDAAVQKSDQNLRNIIGAMKDALWDWDIVNDITTYSTQGHKMLGYTSEEISADRHLLKELVHPEDVPAKNEAMRACFSGETDLYNVEIRLRRKDGTYIWVWTRGHVVEWNDEREPTRMIGIHVDINAKREIEAAYKESELRYRQLFKSMLAGCALHEMICDEKGVPCDYRFLEVNPAFEAQTGLKEEDIIGKTVKEVLPLTEDLWIETCGNVALNGVPIRLNNFSKQLGRHYSVSAYSPRKGLFATVMYDITEQKNAEEAVRRACDIAEEANRTKTQFLANMSHELRTPLNAIIGLSELIEDSPLNDEQKDYIKIIISSGNALLSLISDLLDFSKIEMGKLEVKNLPVCVRDVAEKSISLLSMLAANKGIDLTCTVAEDIPAQITSDANRLQQILVNLLNNALKFTDKGFVKLTVTGRETPSGSFYVNFSVEDSGMGMNEATLRKIFHPFQQGDNSNTREHSGSGLGLAISKNLVQQMGGTIRVESREGRGSIFTFDIPDQTAPGNPVFAEDLREFWRGKTFCVWGDDPADMRTAEVLLERIGIMPRYAETLDAIHQKLTGELPADAVLVNLDMPGFAEQLAEFRKVRPGVPWIGFSNWSNPLDEQVKPCFSAFIDRPLKEVHLYGALMKLAETKV